ncbi:sensor histidine kinase [Leptothrix sp. BB-4]
MRLRTRLQITLATVIAVAVSVCVAIGVMSLRAERLQSALLDAREIGLDLASLQALTLEYALNGENRPVQQWHARLDRLRATAARAGGETLRDHPAMQQMRERLDDVAQTFALFETVRSDADTLFGQRRLDLLVDHLSAQTQDLIELRHEWSGDLAQAAQDNRDLLRTIVPSGLLMMLVMVGMLAWTVSRHVITPLARLHDVARAIQAGDLAARVRSDRDDELGLASRAVDDMAQSLVEQSARLTRSNQDLERFAYVVSHDLQEPLRMVVKYGQLLRKRAHDRLDPDSLEFLDVVIDGGERTIGMVRGLLSLARLDSHGRLPEPVALGEVLDETLAQLHESIETRGARISADPLPTVSGDRLQLGQLFGNLIGNALKFAGSGPPELHIGVQREPGRWRLSFRDRGIGIEADGIDRIFDMFQRLDRSRRTAGHGIGLAICQRVVARHGGTIEVDSRPGLGSTFHVTLADPGTAPGQRLA